MKNQHMRSQLEQDLSCKNVMNIVLLLIAISGIVQMPFL